jgi:hypothetical protein
MDEELDPYVELTEHVHSMHGIPDDARLMGLDRNTEEGAMVALAGSLNPKKLSHRVVAWLVLAGLVSPLLSTAFSLVPRLFS